MIRLFATSVLALALAAGAAQAQPAGPAKRPPGRGGPCGAPLTGQAPDVMTYDRASGTQVFVSGQSRVVRHC